MDGNPFCFVKPSEVRMMNKGMKISFFLCISILVSITYGFGQEGTRNAFQKRGQEKGYKQNQIEKKVYIEQAHMLFKQGEILKAIHQYAQAVFIDSKFIIGEKT